MRLLLHTKLTTIFFVLLFCQYSLVTAQDIVLTDDLKVTTIGKHLQIAEDVHAEYTIHNLYQLATFTPSNNLVPHLGVSNHIYWVRFKILNQSKEERFLITVSNPTIDNIVFYTKNNKQYYDSIYSGEIIPYNKRKYSNQCSVFDVEIPHGSSKEFVMKFSTGEQLQLPIQIGLPEQIFDYLSLKDVLNGAYIGIILVMFLYNLFLFVTVKDKSYIYYVFYILIVGLTQMNFEGYASRFVWTNVLWLTTHSTYILSALVGVLAVSFMRVFLSTKNNVPNWDKGFIVSYGIYGICILLAVMGFYNSSFILVEINAMLTAAYMLYVALKIKEQGYRPASFFLYAWSIFLVGVCVYVLKDFELLPNNIYTNYTMQVGSAIEVVLLSFALADKINSLKKEKELSQLAVNQALRENERIVREHNIILDEKVKVRTLELQNAWNKLNNVLNTLKEAQLKLVESEKMASLGVLTAGIAHEINNPINFVSSSINPLKRDIEFLLSLISKYSGRTKQSIHVAEFVDIHKHEDKIELEYLKEEIETIIKGIEEGATRTKEIVKGLRDFSRLDEDDIKAINIHLGLDSTLIILNNKISNIEVIKNYGVIPEVECFGGKINQVFMNILSNAIDALDNVKDGRKKTLTISTHQDEKNVYIGIKDNAMGIPEEVKKKIFEPFYTTKEVGKGTGLGLSIVHKIIENHKGVITVDSELGKGTEFVISLPKIRQ